MGRRDPEELAAFPAETSLDRIVVAGPDLIVVGIPTGAIIPFHQERAGAAPNRVPAKQRKNKTGR